MSVRAAGPLVHRDPFWETTMNKRMMGGAAATVTATALAALLAHLWPDVRRYLRIRRM
ncbi:hypothetical protein SUDANB105_00950 [Streptomyces sp. enrichment culture]